MRVAHVWILSDCDPTRVYRNIVCTLDFYIAKVPAWMPQLLHSRMGSRFEVEYVRVFESRISDYKDIMHCVVAPHRKRFFLLEI